MNCVCIYSSTFLCCSNLGSKLCLATDPMPRDHSVEHSLSVDNDTEICAFVHLRTSLSLVFPFDADFQRSKIRFMKLGSYILFKL